MRSRGSWIEIVVGRARGAAACLGPAMAAAVAVLLVLVGGSPAARAAISPAPYLDTGFNDALWAEVLNSNWPAGMPDSSFRGAVYTVSAAAGTVPYVARFAGARGSIELPASGSFSGGWKIVRSSDTVWANVSGYVGVKQTNSTVSDEGWCDYGATCYGWGTSYGSTYGTNNQDLIFGSNFNNSACQSISGGLQGWVVHFNPGGFNPATPAGDITCNANENNAYLNASLPGSDEALPTATCNSIAMEIFASYFGSWWSNGTCGIRVWHVGGALIPALPVPYTNQSYLATTTITTPSESTGLQNARNSITSQGCPVENEYNHSVDATNWAAPDTASCGGPISVPTPATYGPPSSPNPYAAPTCSGHPVETQINYSVSFAPPTVTTTCIYGEPVDMATGNFYTGTIDVSLPAVGVPLTFARSYNSADTTGGPLGQGWTDNLDWSATVGSGGNVTIRSGTGQQFGFTDSSGQYVPDAEVRATLSSSGGGYLLTTQDQVSYAFDSSGQLTGVTDRNGQGLSLTYDGSGNLSTVSGSGRTLTFSYSGGLLTGIAVPGGRSVSYGYTGGRLTSFTDLRGNTVSYSYDSSGRLATIVDQNGHTVISNTYDPATGRISGQTDARGHSSSFGWTPTSGESGGTATYTDANGHTWTQLYVNNTLRSEADPLGDTYTYTYDGALNLIAVQNPRGKTTTMTWDPNGNMLTKTAPAPLSYTQSWAYDAKNDVTAYTDGRGHTTSYGYDSHGNLTSVTLPNPSGSGAGPQTTFGRDPTTGLVTSITDPRGKQSTLGYDSAGDLTSVTTPLGYETTYGYDSSGRRTSAVDPRGNVNGANPADYTWTYGYDDADHLTSVTDPLGDETQWSYDPAGNLHTLTDANSNLTTYSYDNANNLTTVTAPDTTTTTYTYDDNGNLASKTDANSHTTTYGYDNANRLTSMVKPGGETWTYTYDADGDVASMVDGNGNATHSGGTTTYGYDALDRLTSVGYSGTVTPNVTYSYDGDGNRTQMTDGAGTVNYTYDNDNRLTAVTRGSQSFSYGYDANSNLTSETYPDSTAASYTYTDDEQLASVTSSSNTTSYAYDPAGNLTTATLPASNGYVQSRTYDNAGRLTEVSNANSGGPLSALAYTLDPAGNPLEVDQTGATTSTTTYGYDSRNWLTSVCLQSSCPNASDPKTSWTYDGVGNRLTQTTPAGTTSYTYNTDDELTAAGTTSYSYDANGNQTAAGSNTFAYDLANRLISATTGSTTTTYGYDGDGNRLTSSDGTNTTNYLWEPLRATPQLDVEQNGSGSDLRTYLYGAGPVSMTTSGSTFYYHTDALGSIANLTDSTGTPQWTYTYDPWGNTTATQDSPGAPTNPVQYIGGYTDPTGLDHLGARQYDPAIGRFLTTDPANQAAGSTYAYASDQPTVAVDPSGLGNSYTIYSGSSPSSPNPSPTPPPSTGSCPWYNPICAAVSVYHAAVCSAEKHPVEFGLTLVFTGLSFASLGVAGAALGGFISADSTLAGLGVGEGGIHAVGTFVQGGAVFAGGALGAGYGASRGCL